MTAIKLTPLALFHNAQMANDWAGAEMHLAENFIYQDFGKGNRLNKAEYLAGQASLHPVDKGGEVWSDEPISSVTDLASGAAAMCFRSVDPKGGTWVVMSDAEWNEAGLLTALREIWHPIKG